MHEGKSSYSSTDNEDHPAPCKTVPAAAATATPIATCIPYEAVCLIQACLGNDFAPAATASNNVPATPAGPLATPESGVPLTPMLVPLPFLWPYQVRLQTPAWLVVQLQVPT